MLNRTFRSLSQGAAAVLLLALVSSASAGEPSLSGAAEREIARRQQQIENGFRLVTEGDNLRAEDDLPGAILNYRAAYMGMQPSAMAEEARAMALARFSAASVEHAKALIAGARYEEASTTLAAVLEPDFDPDYAPALKLRKQLRDPEYYNRALTPEHLENVARVGKAIKTGQEFFDLADFDSAELSYHDALRIDPTNTAARRGLEEVEHERKRYQQAARDETRATMLREVDENWESAVPLDELEIATADRGDLVSGLASDDASADIERLLNEAIVPVVDFEDTSLAEAVEFLAQKSKDYDPLRKGVNIVLALADEDELARNALLNLRLRNVPLAEVLRYITKDTGTQYKVGRFAVTILSQAAASAQLLTRTYSVPPGFLATAPGGDAPAEDPFGAPAADGGGTGLKSNSASAMDFLTSQGITFPEGASAFFNSATSTLTVRNNQTNLDTIENMIVASRRGGARQVVVSVKLIEIKETRAKELGLDTLLGAANVPGSSGTFFSGGTQGNTVPTFSGPNVRSDFTFIPPGTNIPLGVNPLTAGNRSGTIAQPNDSIDGRLRNNLAVNSTTRSPGIFTVAGALTDPQFQSVLRALDQQTGVDVMTSPSTITKSGQRAKIDITREFIYPTEYDPPEIPQDFSAAGQLPFIDPITGLPIDPITGLPITGPLTNDNSSGSIPVTPANPTAFEMRPVGTILEVEPVIGQDGFLVDLNLAIELVRFDGFINYGTAITTGTQVLTPNEILQPVFNTIKETTFAQVYDGSTLFIGGLVNDELTETNDRTPFFSDVPLLGRLFKARTSKKESKVLMIFVSARVIDPAGKAVNPTASR